MLVPRGQRAQMELLVLTLYVGSASLLSLYGLHRVWLLARFRWEPRDAPALGEASKLPCVTVQLPLYDERTVAARLVRAAGALRWPRERLEIQVLDDSTDETRAIVDEEVALLRRAGIAATVIRRPDRRGYKAGALAHGLERAKGELMCVFDADFVPEADFLERLVGHFSDPAVGMVQARWGHLNREASVLTRAEATLLDGHFVVEHTVRHARGLFFNFNGTAGIWRRSAIECSGGWQHDTLTEDLDLSYRAQLAGWRFVYAPEVVAPAELPPDVPSFLSQQHRWAKGSVQVLRKLGPSLLRSDEPWRTKLEALLHLTANAGHPAVLLLALLLPLTAWIAPIHDPRFGLGLFLLGTVSMLLFYDVGPRVTGRAARRRIPDVIAAVALGVGSCLSQTRAVLEGLRGDVGTFVRTPKRGEAPSVRTYRASLLGLPGLELVLALWLAWGGLSAARVGGWFAVPFFALFAWGFAWVGAAGIAERWRRGYWRSSVPVR